MSTAAPGSAPAHRPELQLTAMTEADLPAVLAVERQAYGWPWSQGNFADSLRSGYYAVVLRGGPHLVGYVVAMAGVDEAHLLNITVAPAFQRQGHASLLLQALRLWARGIGAHCLWLEVRASNHAALAVYQHHGFCRVGQRRAYYPQGGGPNGRQREDAVVMSLALA